ncbi:hypothetical protein MMA231_04018 (plasmid) [Asticcacaulis sp. MM231]|uniref:beta strand repeat-containing protein n=1 Tax=Asticcacaulis sp. MM231 TaxID=3157666 RepID=UPI0032D56DBA
MRKGVIGCLPTKSAVSDWKRVVFSTAAFVCLTAASANAGISYGYDSLGRVVSVSYSDGSTVTFQYDAAGNRTQVARIGLNRSPVANNDTVATGYGASFTIDPRTNDTDPDNNPLTVTAVSASAHGTTSYSAASVNYAPTAGYYGADSFTYTISDGQGGTATAAVNVTVGTPATPTVSNKSLSVAYNTAGSVNLAPSGVYTSISIPVGPTNGTTSVSGATATYTPTAGYYGSDSFTFAATGPGGTSAPATVSVSVAAPPAPMASNGSLSVAYNTTGSVGLSPSGVYTSLSIVTNAGHGVASISGTTATYTPTSGYFGADTFTYRATGPGGTSSTATISVSVAVPNLPAVSNVSMSTGYNTAGSVALSPSGVYNSLAVASVPAHGSASISGTTATYTPTAGYYGSDSFTYTATGPGGTSAPGTVAVNIAIPPAPTVGNISTSTAYNASKNVGLSPSGVYTSLAIATGPAHGSASISGSTATYTPAAGYYGSDSFTYTASGPGGTSTAATVTISVATPAAPTVGNVSLSTSYNTANSVGLSPSGVYSSLAIATSPAHGSASISGTTTTYTPTAGYYGADSFTYTATGPGGTSPAATVSVSVATPAAPTAGNVAMTAPYNTTSIVGLAASGVYSSLSVASGPSHGVASISGTTAIYTPTTGYSGPDSFTYTVSGPGGTSAPATVSVTVQPQPIITINVTSAANLRTLANNNGYNGSPASYQFVVPAGTNVMGNAGGGTGIDTGTWPAGVTLALVVNGNLYGGGGTGGNGGGVSQNGFVGANGGDALIIQAPITVTINSGGSIKAGGAGGGGGGYMYGSNPGGSYSNGGGGGGGGFPNGAGGSGGGTNSSASKRDSGSTGSPGTTAGGGAGGSGGYASGSSAPGGAGGNGGAAATSGSTGGSKTYSGAAGGTPGVAIRKNGQAVTIINNGTITGVQN